MVEQRAGSETSQPPRPRRERKPVRAAELVLRYGAAMIDPRPRALPDFVIIGAQKSGTSSLYSQLRAHDSVVPALRKELHFFDRPPKPLRRYLSYFPRQATLARVAERTGRAVTGEATPFYLLHPAAPARLRAVAPNVRLIVVLREPAARAISGYHHAVRERDERRPIGEALDPDAQEEAPPSGATAWYDDPRCPARLHGYLARGRYAEQLERWFAEFPREQVLVLESGDLRGGRVPQAALSFLDLSGSDAPVVPNRNVGLYAPPSSELEASLRDYFRPHNARLFELLGTDLGWPS